MSDLQIPITTPGADESISSLDTILKKLNQINAMASSAQGNINRMNVRGGGGGYGPGYVPAGGPGTGTSAASAAAIGAAVGAMSTFKYENTEIYKIGKLAASIRAPDPVAAAELRKVRRFSALEVGNPNLSDAIKNRMGRNILSGFPLAKRAFQEQVAGIGNDFNVKKFVRSLPKQLKSVLSGRMPSMKSPLKNLGEAGGAGLLLVAAASYALKVPERMEAELSKATPEWQAGAERRQAVRKFNTQYGLKDTGMDNDTWQRGTEADKVYWRILQDQRTAEHYARSLGAPVANFFTGKGFVKGSPLDEKKLEQATTETFLMGKYLGGDLNHIERTIRTAYRSPRPDEFIHKEASLWATNRVYVAPSNKKVLARTVAGG